MLSTIPVFLVSYPLNRLHNSCCYNKMRNILAMRWTMFIWKGKLRVSALNVQLLYIFKPASENALKVKKVLCNYKELLVLSYVLLLHFHTVWSPVPGILAFFVRFCYISFWLILQIFFALCDSYVSTELGHGTQIIGQTVI